MNQPYSFSPETSLLLEWGKTDLQEDKLPEFLADIKKEIEKEKSFCEECLEVDFATILEQSASARRILSDISIIGLTQDDWEWNDVLYSFDSLDIGVFLMRGIDGVLRNMHELYAERIFNSLNSQLEKTFGLILSETFSALRFVPFNQHRKNRLLLIEEPSRYLFPWYELLCDESLDTIDELAACYHFLGKGILPGQTPDYINENMDFYIREIMRDNELNDYIRNENRLLFSMERTVSKHWALRLWNSVKRAGAKRLLPENVESLGISKVSEAVFQTKGASKIDPLLMEIIKACYSPNLDEGRRLEILLACEEKLKSFDDYEIGGAKSARDGIASIIGLGNGSVGADEAAESLLDIWIDLTTGVATEMSTTSYTDKIIRKVDVILQEGKILFESLPHVFQLAGQPVTAADTLQQSKTFFLGAGEWIKIACDWQRRSKNVPAHFHLEWKANITTSGKLWARFINSDTGERLNDLCLGNRLEGRRDFESHELGFDPIDERWAISIIFESD